MKPKLSKQVKPKSKSSKLYLFLTEGILRVCGRLAQADLFDNIKYQKSTSEKPELVRLVNLDTHFHFLLR